VRKEKKLTNLIKNMSLDEKLGQLNLLVSGNNITGTSWSDNIEDKIKNGLAGGLFGAYCPDTIRQQQDVAVQQSRLKIPLLFGLDVIHGHKTLFPIPLALSCTWDESLIKETARTAAKEASADGLNWVFSPMVDITRDPRWGRVAEGSGEDPYLGSLISKAMVEGLQGDDLSKKDTVLACVKHMALYGAAEAGRDYNTVDMSDVKMHEEYLPPYKAAVDAGVRSVMTAFNDVNGTPCTASKKLFTDILREQWGFDGFVVTDYTAINEMVDHGIGDLEHASALALKAGVDMDMVGEGFLTTLKGSLAKGTITEDLIDKACYNILSVKYDLGLFEDPYRYIDSSRPAKEILTDDNRALARKAAAKSCVLLKNDNNTLPLKADSKVAVIGPMADNKQNMLGMWNIAGDHNKAITILKGLQDNADPSMSISHAKGENLIADYKTLTLSNWNAEHNDRVTYDTRSAEEMIKEALDIAKDADVILAVVGEAQEMSGESASRTDISLPESQQNLLKALKETGKPLALVTMSGRPLTLGWEAENADAILHAWFGGTEAGNGIADVLLGKENPSGKLTMTFPHNVGQIPIYYAHKNTGRPLQNQEEPEKYKSCYMDAPNSPLYPFGFGLSYTNFTYSPITLDKTKLKDDETLKASVNIKNTGEHKGEEIVQLYITDPVASLTRAVKNLKGHKKISLEPGEEKTITFEIKPDALKFFNESLEYDWEPGEFIIHIGTNSRDTHKASVEWQKTQAPAASNSSPKP
jgi:beta-glucosidase